MNPCRVVVLTKKEIIKDKNLIFNDVKEVIKELKNSHIVTATIINTIRQSSNINKQIVQEQKTVVTDLNLPRNEFPIDELEYEGKIYPFSKTRLAVSEENSNDAFITYIFDGGKEELDLDSLFVEFKEILKRDKEFLEIKERIWPEGFTNESDKKNFEERKVKS
ncbi:hypothetical protein COM33_25265 [Bacillus toyonensis]|uniref:Uncharacterized protein n=1 Tax=Bacillus toyonensis TaxID=155322 RepID=A0AB36SN88_9BACI|nr:MULTISPECIES: hypothetical protein [Bacillus]EEL19792.1 hypothetical protein bcere0017_54240 [Bacillus cereus Rock1-3]KNH41484.1 hypothetical protein ACS75_06595 [Bacillus thuringiensis]KXY15771.1 hypothetical protein AT259_23830 [Bacillus cereus]MDH8708395.1 hypothetical protein [Stenotrophomonas sp. 1198]EJQ73306.1 hypothetical protein IGK_05380 [Bacillus toyonensis]